MSEEQVALSFFANLGKTQVSGETGWPLSFSNNATGGKDATLKK